MPLISLWPYFPGSKAFLYFDCDDFCSFCSSRAWSFAAQIVPGIPTSEIINLPLLSTVQPRAYAHEMTCLFSQIDEQGGISTLYINRMLEPTVRAEVGATYLSEPGEPKVRHTSSRKRACVGRMVEDEKEKRLCKLARVYLQQTSNPLHKHSHADCQNCISIHHYIISRISTSSPPTTSPPVS